MSDPHTNSVAGVGAQSNVLLQQLLARRDKILEESPGEPASQVLAKLKAGLTADEIATLDPVLRKLADSATITDKSRADLLKALEAAKPKTTKAERKEVDAVYAKLIDPHLCGAPTAKGKACVANKEALAAQLERLGVAKLSLRQKIELTRKLLDGPTPPHAVAVVESVIEGLSATQLSLFFVALDNDGHAQTLATDLSASKATLDALLTQRFAELTPAAAAVVLNKVLSSDQRMAAGKVAAGLLDGLHQGTLTDGTAKTPFEKGLLQMGVDDQFVYVCDTIASLGRIPGCEAEYERLLSAYSGVGQLVEPRGAGLYITEAELKKADEILTRLHALSQPQQEAIRKTIASENPGFAAALDCLERKKDTYLDERHVEPLKLSEVQQKLGWAPDDARFRLLQAMDGAGLFEANDGAITVAEILAGLMNPRDVTKVSTEAVLDIYNVLSAQPNGTMLIKDLPLPWMRAFSAKADKNGDQSIDQAELRAWGQTGALDEYLGSVVAVTCSAVAELTGELDPFKVDMSAFPYQGKDLTVYENIVYRGAMADPLLSPAANRHAITWADNALARADAVDRASFQVTPGYAKRLSLTDYKRTEGQPYYDMGHAAENSGQPRASLSKHTFFIPTNAFPQAALVNERPWRLLEDRYRTIAEATHADLTIATGALWLRPKGLDLSTVKTLTDLTKYKGADLASMVALTKEEIASLQSKPGFTMGAHKISVPTHCYKSVLLEMPDGRAMSFTYVLANDDSHVTAAEKAFDEREAKAKAEAKAKKDKTILDDLLPQYADLLQEGQVSWDDVARLSGVALFKDYLPPGADAVLRTTGNAALRIATEDKNVKTAMRYLWSDKNPEVAPWIGPLRPTRVEGFLEHLDLLITDASSRKAA